MCIFEIRISKVLRIIYFFNNTLAWLEFEYNLKIWDNIFQLYQSEQSNNQYHSRKFIRNIFVKVF